MKKKVIVVLMCVGSHIFGMYQYKPVNFGRLSNSKPDPETKIVRYRRKKLSSDESKYISILLGCVQDNRALNLKYQLDDKSDRIETNWLGHSFFIPGVLRNLLRHRSSALLLYEAVNRRHERCVKLLLEYNAFPNIAIEGGDTPLHVAKSSTVVQLLMDHGALIDQKNDCGETPFFKSIKNSCLEMAQVLYAAGADVNACNKDNNTPLHYAAKYLKDGDIIQFLLYHGASIDCKNNSKETPYQIIYKRGGAILKAFRAWQKVVRAITVTIKSLSVMSLLDRNCKQLKKLLICDTSDYCSPSIAIAERLFNRCDDDVWDTLKNVYSGAVLFFAKCVKKRSEHRTYFLNALRNNDFFTANQLLQENPYLLHAYEGEYAKDEVNALFVDKVITSCAHNAQYPYLQQMMHSGFFDVDGDDAWGTPTLVAVIQQANSGNKYLDLLKAGVHVNAQDAYGNTALTYATMLSNKDMVLRLLLYGAVVNEKFGDSFEISSSMSELIVDAYKKQKCCKCETHDYDLSAIPCVNRHLRHFICSNCYKKDPKECPLCRRSMGVM